MSLAIVGGTVVDVILPGVNRLPAWPRHTEFTTANLVFLPRAPLVTLGGNGANAAYVASSAGASVILHTQIGGDELGGLARAWLKNVGCPVVTAANASTAINVTAANPGLERATFFYPGKKIMMPKLSAQKNVPGHLLVCGWPHPPLKILAAQFSALRRRGTFTALDAGPILERAWSLAALGEVLAELDLFLSNDYELRRITRTKTLNEGLAKLRRCFDGHIVIKRGAKGSVWMERGSAQALSFPRCRVRVINTIGAGDSFNGALMAALSLQKMFPDALLAATRTAANVVSSARGILGCAGGTSMVPSA